MGSSSKHPHRLLGGDHVGGPVLGQLADVVDVPAVQHRGCVAADGDHAHNVQSVGVAGGEHGAINVGEADLGQRGHAGGFVGEAQVVGHWVTA